MTDSSLALQSEIDALTQRANAGDLHAGLLLSHSLLKAGARTESLQQLLKTAQAGHPVAATDLGVRLLSGLDAPYDPYVGMKWLHSGATAGYPEAMRFLALAYAAGEGCPQDFGRAYALLEQAAGLGESACAQQLAILSEAGLHTSAALSDFLRPVTLETAHDAPRIRYAPECVPRAMCNWWIAHAQSTMDLAAELDGPVHSPDGHGVRIGFGLIDTDVVMQLVLARLAAAIGRPQSHQEAPNVLHYVAGEQYEPHFDWLDPDAAATRDDLVQNGQRAATALIYLNEDFTGGETGFDTLGGSVRVPAGGLLTFENLTPEGAPDRRTLHSGRPPVEGEKWLLSVWVRDRAQRRA